MQDLRTHAYKGDDISRGTVFLISDIDYSETYPRAIAVALEDIPASTIEEAHRLASLNEMSLTSVLEIKGVVELHPVHDLRMDVHRPEVEFHKGTIRK